MPSSFGCSCCHHLSTAEPGDGGSSPGLDPPTPRFVHGLELKRFGAIQAFAKEYLDRVRPDLGLRLWNACLWTFGRRQLPLTFEVP